MPSRRTSVSGVALLLAAVVVASCAGPDGQGSADRSRSSATRPPPSRPTATPTTTAPTTVAPITPRRRYPRGTIAPTAFGMHFLGWGEHPYPSALRFGSARVWDMWVRWTDLQPTADVTLSDANPAVRRLDAIVAGFWARGVEPLLVLGGTPPWAATDCPRGRWPEPTCGPRETGPDSPWAAYVRFLASRYPHVWFETWNEPNLRNGYNDDIARLAAMQRTAYRVIHDAHTGARLLSPSVAVTAGRPLAWLDAFFAEPGGLDFDAFAVHLYPSDAAARAGTGPEWSVDVLDHEIRPLLRRHHLSTRVWDTEVNVGRAYKGISFFRRPGAALLARTYLLQLSDRVTRVYWYAADDRYWTGTPVERSDLRTPTAAGRALAATLRMLVGTRPLGCRRSVGAVTRYTCAFRRGPGDEVLAMWTVGGVTTIAAPAGTRQVVDVFGAARPLRTGAGVRVTSVPRYLVVRTGRR